MVDEYFYAIPQVGAKPFGADERPLPSLQKKGMKSPAMGGGYRQ